MLSPEELTLYKTLFKIISDPVISEPLAKYARIQYDIAVKNVRSKKDVYEYGYFNGIADAYQNMIQLKSVLLNILKSV